MRRLRKASEHREQTSVYICIYSRHLQNVDRSVGEEEKRKGQKQNRKVIIKSGIGMSPIFTCR